MALRVIPQTLSLPLFPVYSRTAHLSPENFAEAYRWSVKFFLLLSIPFAVFFMAWSGPILRLALGAKYLTALPAMQWLGLGLVPFFLSTLFQYLFAALDQQKLFLINTCVGSTFRLVLLVVLIPYFGFVGPSIAFVCGETIVVTLWMMQLGRLGFSAHFLSIAWRPLIAGAAMGWLLYATRSFRLPMALLPAAFSPLLYFGLLFVLRTFSTEELQHAREGLNFVSPFIAAWTKKIKGS